MSLFFRECEDFNKRFMKRSRKNKKPKTQKKTPEVYRHKSDVLNSTEIQSLLDAIDNQN